MKKHAYDAAAKANGLMLLRGLHATGKVYEAPYDANAIAKRRKKAKAAKKMRKINR